MKNIINLKKTVSEIKRITANGNYIRVKYNPATCSVWTEEHVDCWSYNTYHDANIIELYNGRDYLSMTDIKSLLAKKLAEKK